MGIYTLILVSRMQTGSISKTNFISRRLVWFFLESLCRYQKVTLFNLIQSSLPEVSVGMEKIGYLVQLLVEIFKGKVSILNTDIVFSCFYFFVSLFSFSMRYDTWLVLQIRLTTRNAIAVAAVCTKGFELERFVFEFYY